MAQHAVEAAEADDDESLAERKGDVDESKFSSLTAALLVRKRPAPASSLSAMAADLRKPQSGDALPSDFLVRKGEAEPSLPVPLGGAPSPGEQQNEELARLRSQVSALQIKLATSEAEIARLQHGDAQAREELLLEAEEQFAKAEADWKAEAARQLAAVEARWQEDYRKGVAGARSEAGRQVAVSEAQWEEKLKRSVAELRATSEGARLQSERALNGLRAAIASRETDIRQLQAAGEGERAQSQRELRDALSKAEASWKAEAARLRAEAETLWRQQSERALADAQIQWRQQSENALAEAQAQTAALRQRAWKAQETARLSAEAEWKRQAARELADATARFEAAERSLAQLRIRNGARDAGDNEEILRLRDEIATLQRRTSQRPADHPPHETTQVALRTNKDWNALSQTRNAEGESNGKRMPALIGAALVIATGLTVYIGMDVLGLKLPLPDISSVFSSTITAPSTTPKPAAQKKLQAVTLDRGANMRSGPNMQAPVVAFLKKGAQVTPGQTTGNWTEVRVTGGAKGWVFSEFVQPPAPVKKAPEKTPAKPPAPRAKPH